MEDHHLVPPPPSEQAVQVEPYYICHENYYDHLFSVLKRLDTLMDCYVVLSNNEFILTHHFVLSAFSGCVHSLPRHTNSLTYVLLKDVDAWSVKCLIEYIHSGALGIPKHNLVCMNRILQILDMELGSEFFENEDVIHFTLNQTLKYNIINKIWLNRNDQCDVKILTKGMHEVYAHSAILSACSDQLFTLFRAHGMNCKPVLIVLLEFDYEDVETVLKFCYKGEVEIQRNKAGFVCELAKILGIKDLYNTVSNLGYQIKNSLQDNSNKNLSKISCWEHKETTKKIFRTLFEKESLSDIQLICSDHTFKVHSAVLNLSPYFQSLFELNDWRHSLIFLSDLSLETVQAFVDYMYYGEVLYSGNVQDFTKIMQGLIDFSIMPINNVEKIPSEQNWIGTNEEMEIACPSEVKQEEIQCKRNDCEPQFPTPTPHNGTSHIYNPPVTDSLPPPVQNKNIKNTIQVPKENKLLTYTCDTCSAIFYSRRSLKLHLNSHPESKNTQCSYCDLIFERPALLKIHERSHTGSRPFLCTTCGKSYSSQSALGKHNKTHGDNQVFECALCTRTCSRKEYLEEHIRTHTGSKPYKCTVCGKRFVGKTGLNHHLKVHDPPRKDSVCEICGKAFTRKALWTHMKTHDKQYKCETCHKYFSTPGTLRSHNAMTHFEDKLYPCDICGKKFALPNHLNRHKKNVHDPSRLYHCDKCPKVLSSELKLEAHEKSKHSQQKDKSYPCNLCSKKFSGRSALIYHRRSHTGHKPHACGMCTKSFLRPDALQKHLRSHTHERPYRCNLCEQRCCSKSALNQHMKRHKNKQIKKENQQSNKKNIENESIKNIKQNHIDDVSKEIIIHDLPLEIIKELKPCMEGGEISRIHMTCEEPVLEPLQSMAVDVVMPQQYIQVYVPGSADEQHAGPSLVAQDLPVMQMAVQETEPQYIQVYVPSSMPEQHPSQYQ